jgi:hypothetical protein
VKKWAACCSMLACCILGQHKSSGLAGQYCRAPGAAPAQAGSTWPPVATYPCDIRRCRQAGFLRTASRPPTLPTRVPAGNPCCPQRAGCRPVQAILGAKLSNPNHRFMLSIAGWGHKFACPANPGLWLTNAINSLYGMVQQFYLDGIDINYEAS